MFLLLYIFSSVRKSIRNCNSTFSNSRQLRNALEIFGIALYMSYRTYTHQVICVKKIKFKKCNITKNAVTAIIVFRLKLNSENERYIFCPVFSSIENYILLSR